MAKRKTKSHLKKRSGLTLVIVLLLALAYFLYPYLDLAPAPVTDTSVEGQLLIHVIDVGQADAILLQAPEGNVLIDAGDNNSTSQNALKNYLDAQGITTLDYFVMTHVHADHIGGADMILQTYTVKNAVMTADVATTKVYESMLDALEQSGANVIEAVPEQTFSIGDLHCRILAPLDDYDDANDMSVVLRATFGTASMMFTGDAEGNQSGHSEKDIVATYSAAELQSDFYKAGHHGSDTSSSAAFLKAVSPKIVAVSVGEGNSYGHPAKSTMDAFSAIGAEVYRTDLMGDLVFISDGESIRYQK